MRESPRTRRLRSDHKSLETLVSQSTIFEFTAHGSPPESYEVRFLGKGLQRPNPYQSPTDQDIHKVRIRLGASYPRVMPEMQWLTPFYHPNVSAAGMVCLGGYGTYWVPSLNLDELCEMLWDMIRYANFDITSPYNRDAADWAKDQRRGSFPLDRRSIRDKIAPAPMSPPLKSTIPEVLILNGDEDIAEAQPVEQDDSDVLFIE